MRTLRASLVSLFLLSSLVAFFPTANAAQDDAIIEVDRSEASPHFPDDIGFELDAIIDGDVESIDLVYQQARLETLFLLPAQFDQDGDALEADAEADLTTSFLPVGIDLTFHWLITLDNEAIVETEPEVVTWIDDRFDWDRDDANGVEIYSYDRSDDFVQLMVDTSNEAVAVLTERYEIADPWPIRVWVYESGRDYAGTLAQNSQEWSAGSAYPDLQVIQAVIPNNSESEVLRVLPHEISHQLLHMATLNPYNSPATWLDEGLAVYAQTGGKAEYRRVVLEAFKDDELVSLQSLISSFPYDSAGARLAYAESFSVVEYLIGVYGEDAIFSIVNAYRVGNSHNDVLVNSIGLTIPELDQAWRDSLAVQADQ